MIKLFVGLLRPVRHLWSSRRQRQRSTRHEQVARHWQAHTVIFCHCRHWNLRQHLTFVFNEIASAINTSLVVAMYSHAPLCCSAIGDPD